MNLANAAGAWRSGNRAVIQSVIACVHHQPGIDLLTRVIRVENILFASEMIGAVRGIDPETGHYFDDTKRYIEAAHVDAHERYRIHEGNARRVYPRLDAATCPMLAERVREYERLSGRPVIIESVGGVAAARRVPTRNPAETYRAALPGRSCSYRDNS